MTVCISEGLIGFSFESGSGTLNVLGSRSATDESFESRSVLVSFSMIGTDIVFPAFMRRFIRTRVSTSGSFAA